MRHRMTARQLLRAWSRDTQRRNAQYNGPAPRYEPARNDYCPEHFRQVPCKRCPQPEAAEA